MAIDRTVKFTVRLNMLNPAHVTINKVLNELNLDIFKSKNQFYRCSNLLYRELWAGRINAAKERERAGVCINRRYGSN